MAPSPGLRAPVEEPCVVTFVSGMPGSVEYAGFMVVGLEVEVPVPVPCGRGWKPRREKSVGVRGLRRDMWVGGSWCWVCASWRLFDGMGGGVVDGMECREREE